MDEEKTIDEAVEEQAVDEVVEQADEMKEFEPVAFDEVIKETEPERKDAPVLRALGDPDPADMNMIHKHLDNFLAMLCGETPIDDNVRTSTEYWLKRLADGNGGSTKKIYWHTIEFKRLGVSVGYIKAYFIILSTQSAAFTSDSFKTLMATPGFVAICVQGHTSLPTTGSSDEDALNEVISIANNAETQYILTYRIVSTGAIATATLNIDSYITVTDLGVNAIN